MIERNFRVRLNPANFRSRQRKSHKNSPFRNLWPWSDEPWHNAKGIDLGTDRTSGSHSELSWAGTDCPRSYEIQFHVPQSKHPGHLVNVQIWTEVHISIAPCEMCRRFLLSARFRCINSSSESNYLCNIVIIFTYWSTFLHFYLELLLIFQDNPRWVICW
jgi:hypothetical protein